MSEELNRLIEQDYTGNILIDTHVLIWATLEPERLSPFARKILKDGKYRILVSTVSPWEMLIKTQKGKFDFEDPANLAMEMLQSLDAHWLPIEPSHVVCLGQLPVLHKDPFDRMLLAQSVQGGIPLLTGDTDLHRYAGRGLHGTPDRKPLLIW